jgi:hypothetical protein
MKNPVIAADGYNYDYPAIKQWFEKSNKSPMTNLPINTNLYPNIALRNEIREYLISQGELDSDEPVLDIFQKMSNDRNIELGKIDRGISDTSVEISVQNKYFTHSNVIKTSRFLEIISFLIMFILILTNQKKCDRSNPEPAELHDSGYLGVEIFFTVLYWIFLLTGIFHEIMSNVSFGFAMIACRSVAMFVTLFTCLAFTQNYKKSCDGYQDIMRVMPIPPVNCIIIVSLYGLCIAIPILMFLCAMVRNIFVRE